MMMYDLEKASISAPGISLYVSDDPRGSDEVLGPAGAEFPDQEARPVIWKSTSSPGRKPASLTVYKLSGIGIYKKG